MSPAIARATTLILVIGAPLAMMFTRLGRLFNHDTSWYLAATRNWLDGGTLYAEVVELNPPMAYYLTAPAILLADRAGVDDAQALLILLAAGCALSLGTLAWVTARSDLGPEQRLLIVASGVAALCVVPLGHYAQREHLMLIATLPLVAQRALGRADDRKAEISTALLAVPGLLLKPHFLLIPAAIVLAEALQTRRWRALFAPYVLVIGTAALGYLCFVLVQHPEYLREVVPLAQANYPALSLDPLMVVTARPVWMLPLVLVICLLLIKPGPARQRALLAVAAVTGGVLAYLAQFKGFDYHRMAPEALAVWSLGMLVALALPLSPKKLSVAIAAAALALLPMPQALRGALGPPDDQPMLRAALPPSVRQGEEKLVLYSLFLRRSFPMVNATGMRWASRYPSFWYLTGAMRALNTPGQSEETRHAATAALNLLRRHMAEDLARHKPEYALVDTLDVSGWLRDPDFNLHAFLLENDAFAREWQAYRFVQTVGDTEIWVRQLD